MARLHSEVPHRVHFGLDWRDRHGRRGGRHGGGRDGRMEGTTEGTEGTEEMLNPLEVGLSNAHAVAFEKRKTLDQVGEESSDELQALDSSSSEEKSSHLDRSGRLGVMKRKQNEQQ